MLGKAPTTGTVSLSGSTLTEQELAWRTALALGYVIISMLGVAAVALFFSTLTRSSIGAALERSASSSPRPCYLAWTRPMRYIRSCRPDIGLPLSTCSVTPFCGGM